MTQADNPLLALLLAVSLVVSGVIVAAPASAQSQSIETDTEQRAIAAATGTAVAESQASWDTQVNGSTRTTSFSGSGTEADPYVIDSLVDLQAINKNSTTRSHAYKLDSDIDASETRNWNGGEGFDPIGSFSGTFDGDGNEISDLYIDRPSTDKVGLFLAGQQLNDCVQSVGVEH